MAFDKDYMKFHFYEDGDIKMDYGGSTKTGCPTLQVSTDNGSTWSDYTYGDYIQVEKGDVVAWRGNAKVALSKSSTQYVQFYTDTFCKVDGNLQTLIDYEAMTMTTIPNYCFYNLFRQCRTITSFDGFDYGFGGENGTCGNYSLYSFFGYTNASGYPPLLFDTVNNYGYAYMFNSIQCKKMPMIYTKNFGANSCNYMIYDTQCEEWDGFGQETVNIKGNQAFYNFMYNSSKLKKINAKLPKVTFSSTSYTATFSNFFNGCMGLEEVPDDFFDNIKESDLKGSMFQGMFTKCYSLKKAPKLPYTTLTNQLYTQMFNDCKSLEEAPELPALTMTSSCYNQMFAGCTSLKKAPKLPATTLAATCYNSMFKNCTSLVEAPLLPALTMAQNCYNGMFDGCSSLVVNSESSTGYATEWRIPYEETGEVPSGATGWNTNMLRGTAGTQTADPVINTTYYIKKEIGFTAFKDKATGTISPIRDKNALSLDTMDVDIKRINDKIDTQRTSLSKSINQFNIIRIDTADGQGGDKMILLQRDSCGAYDFPDHIEVPSYANRDDVYSYGGLWGDDLVLYFDKDGNKVNNYRPLCGGTLTPRVKRYMSIKALENTTVRISVEADALGTPTAQIKYKIDDGAEQDYNYGESGGQGDAITLTEGQTVYFRNTVNRLSYGQDTATSNKYRFNLSSTGDIEAGGDLLAMVNWDKYNLSGYFINLFKDCNTLKTVPTAYDIQIITVHCFMRTFEGCTGLTSAKRLFNKFPARVLYPCFNFIFKDCTNLEEGFDMPNRFTYYNTTSVANYGGMYQSMFEGCSNLKRIKTYWDGKLKNDDTQLTNPFTDWVKGVEPGGLFYYNGTEAEFGDGSIPTGWQVCNFQYLGDE